MKARRQAYDHDRQGAAAVATVILLVLLNLIILGMVGRSASDQDIAVTQVAAVQTAYAAEAAVSLAMAEIMNNSDIDGDGTLGSISNDGNDDNNPLIGGIPVKVSRTDLDEGTRLLASAASANCRRTIQCMALLSGVGPTLEVGSMTVTATPSTVKMKRTYTDPVIVCTPQYRNNTQPIVVRMSNVTSTTFDVWLQNPGDLAVPAAETVYYIAMEVGSYDSGGLKYEAHKYSSNVTDRANHFNGQNQTYINSYEVPVVVGQVMTANDLQWSVFWCMGQNAQQAPHKYFLSTGKHVAEDTVTNRAHETIGYIVFEQAHGRIGAMPYDAVASSPSVEGVDNSPPDNVTFFSAFTTAPQVLLVGQAGMRDNDGGWGLIYGNPPCNKNRAYCAIDEDKIGDAERSHAGEQVSVLAFTPPGPKAAVTSWAPVAPQ